MDDLPTLNMRLVDAAYTALRDLILSGRLQPGDRLDVDDLARRMKVSRTPVKDALNRLEAQGLVEVAPRHATFVRRLTAGDIAETFEIRAALEGLAAERVAAGATAAEIAILHTSLAELRRDADDPDMHWLRNAEFHRRMIEFAGNQRLRGMYDDLQAHIQIARMHRSTAEWHGRASREEAEHDEIVKAIEAHDPERARAAVVAHVVRAARSLLSDFERDVDPNGGPAASGEVSPPEARDPGQGLGSDEPPVDHRRRDRSSHPR